MAILYDDEYHGPRYRYGLTLRPLGAGVPRGWITFSDRPSTDPRCPFGTVDYPAPLSDFEVSQLSLIDFGQVDDGSSAEHPNLTAQLLRAED